MKAASFIISHAGAGSIMEGLSLEKRMLVVINAALMDNHQCELAYALQKRNHLMCSESPEQIFSDDLLCKLSSFEPVNFQDIRWAYVAKTVDETMNFVPCENHRD